MPAIFNIIFDGQKRTPTICMKTSAIIDKNVLNPKILVAKNAIQAFLRDSVSKFKVMQGNTRHMVNKTFWGTLWPSQQFICVVFIIPDHVVLTFCRESTIKRF